MTELGLHFMHGARVGSDTARLEKLAKLAIDPRWGVAFKLIDIGHVPLKPLEPVFKGAIKAPDLPAAARTALLGPYADRVHFGVSRKQSLDPARFFINTGRFMNNPCWGNTSWQFSDEDAAAAWIALQHEIVETAQADHAVLVVAPTDKLLRIEIWLSNISVEGRDVHPRPDEISSYGVNREELGDSVLRAPRWGTYLSSRHLDAIGGRATVISTVEPAIVREVGSLTYFQLSEHVADALTPATEAKRARFESLVAPHMPRRE